MAIHIPPFYDKKIPCLFCHDIYTSKRIRSRFIRVEKVHSDFYQEFKDPDLNPYFYEVDVCPKCGFASTENFSDFFPPGSKEVIKNQLKNWHTQNFGVERTIEMAIQATKLGILSAMLKKEKHIVIAGLCMRLSWLYRKKDVKEQELRFLNEALVHYKMSYQETDYVSTKMTEIKLLYIIGELARRTGDEEEAIRSFSRVIQHKNKEFEPKTVEMAREQWYVMRYQEEEQVTT